MLSYRAVLIELGFFGLIGFSLWITREPLVLLALFLTPKIEENNDKKESDQEDDNKEKDD